jgi:hypothetical protein
VLANGKAVYTRIRGLYRFVRLGPNVCRVTVVIHGDVGGSIPKIAMRGYVRAKRARRTMPACGGRACERI